MNISAHTPTRSLAQLSPLKTPVRNSAAKENAAVPGDSVDLSAALPTAAPQGKTLAKQASSTGARIFGALGLGLVALSLAGCGGGSTPTPAPAQPNQTQQQPGQNQAQATSYAQRMEQLKSQSDKTGYHQMAEAGYQRAILQRFANATDPASKPAQEIAQRGVEAFNYNASPAEQQKLMRDVMQAIAELKSDAPEVVRYTQAAQGALRVGQAFSDGAKAAPGGIVGQVKSRAYEEAFKTVLQRLRQAPEQLKNQSGHDPALIRNYVESLALGPEVALEFGAQLNDSGLATVLYSSTGDVLYQRVSTDGGVLGAQVTSAIQLIQNLRSQFGL
jgi:hypothetical protein